MLPGIPIDLRSLHVEVYTGKGSGRRSGWGLPESRFSEQVRQQGGASKSRFEMLLGEKEHEMHHRGQLTVIERLLGIVPHLTRNRQAAREAAAKQRQAPAASPTV
jgi:hypothetical protein